MIEETDDVWHCEVSISEIYEEKKENKNCILTLFGHINMLIDKFAHIRRKYESIKKNINITDHKSVIIWDEGFCDDWNISNLFSDISLHCTNLSVSNYDSLLIGWNKYNLKSNIVLKAGDLIYCQGEADRDSIIANYDWTINDNGKDSTMYITTPHEVTVKSGETFVVDVNNNLVLVPINSNFYGITGGADAGKFSISLNDGQFSFINPPDFYHPTDKNKDNVYRVQVKVYNSSVERDDFKTFKIKVTPKKRNLVPVIIYLLN